LDRRLRRAALGKSYDDAIDLMLPAYREFAKERPAVYEATLHAPAANDLQIQSASQAIVDTVLTVLESYNLNHDDAIHVVRGFRAIGHGFATLEVTGAFGIALETDVSYRRLITAFLRGLNSVSKAE
jgi:Tetracyclin repressor-like, C-terminal domain